MRTIAAVSEQRRDTILGVLAEARRATPVRLLGMLGEMGAPRGLPRLCLELRWLAEMGYVQLALAGDGEIGVASLTARGGGLRYGEALGPVDIAAMAVEGCECKGSGWVIPYRMCSGAGGKPRVCGCVLRAIFESCRRRYMQTREGSGRGRVRIEVVPGCGLMASMWGAEYVADFETTARRALAGHPQEWAVFEGHILCELGVEDCRRQLVRDGWLLSKGNYWHAVYRMKELVGRAYLANELLPGEYFRRRPLTYQGVRENGIERRGGYCAGVGEVAYQ